MADLVVKDDLASLADDLNSLISEFQNANSYQDGDKGKWGQLNANLSMGDFADNWKQHRDDMVKKMQSLLDSVNQVNQAWAQADQQLRDSLEQS
jgi:hypothetical protein